VFWLFYYVFLYTQVFCNTTGMSHLKILFVIWRLLVSSKDRLSSLSYAFPLFIKSFKTTSKSASYTCELPECYPLQAICASRVVSNPLLCNAGITTYENISTSALSHRRKHICEICNHYSSLLWCESSFWWTGTDVSGQKTEAAGYAETLILVY
jgi:hypothetical protein